MHVTGKMCFGGFICHSPATSVTKACNHREASWCWPARKTFHVFKTQCWYTHYSPRITRTGPSFILAHALSTVVQSTSLAGHSRAISVTVSKLPFLDNRLTNSALRCEVSEIMIKARTTAQVLPCLLNKACPQCFTLRGCPQFTSKTSTRAKVNQNSHSGPNDSSQDENFYTCV